MNSETFLVCSIREITKDKLVFSDVENHTMCFIQVPKSVLKFIRRNDFRIS